MRFRLSLAVICLLASTAFAQNAGTAKSPMEEAFSRLEYRSIGPAIMGGRIADVEGIPGDPNVVYVASASGGLWKTTNGGVTWKPIFERQGTMSIGDIDRKSTRLNSSHSQISYAVFCLKKKKKKNKEYIYK